ncbi:MAG: ABC transporter ATP-binding protein [Balneolaceae bacterium]|nr:ABC transporter ATP-binding protein [Balneolaceae bacterium]
MQAKSLNSYYKPYWTSYLVGALFLTLANVFLIWIPRYIREMMDEIGALQQMQDGIPSNMIDVLFNSEAGQILATNAGLLLGSVILYGFFLFATRQTIIISSRKIEFDMRTHFVEKLVRLSQDYFTRTPSGDTYVRATEDISRVRDYYGPVFMYTVNTITRATFVITMMISVNPTLTRWSLIPLPIMAICVYWISRYIHKYQTAIQEQYSVLAGRAQEAFSSIRLIKAFQREDYEMGKFTASSEDYRKRKLSLDLVESIFHPSINFLIGLAVMIVVWKGGQMAMNGMVTVGNIAEFVIYVAYLTWPVASLGYTLNLYQKSMASWERLKQFMSEPEETDPVMDVADLEPTIPPTLSVALKNVTFSYPTSETPALESISLTIPAGSKCAIVGRTGSGKSTVAQLIPGIFTPTSGTILVNDTPIEELNVHQLRRWIGYVPQESFLFSNTIGENIGFGVSSPSLASIERAADQAEVLENIQAFDKQFDTMVGERGITLSGGQKQRAAIARALIKDPPMIILDDSLSAVDTKTEHQILHTLQSELQDKTVLTISHRISSVQNADRIYVLDKGRLVEEGTHQELLNQKGVYHRMSEAQKLEEDLVEIS